MPKPSDKLTILYEDADLVAVDKPPGLAVIPGRAEATSVLEVLATQLGLPDRGTTDPRVRVVHRLDKDTSGVLLFAKHTSAQRFVSHQFQNNTVHKEYFALVAGRPAEDEGEIDAHRASPRRATTNDRGQARRPSRADALRIEQTFRDFALLRVFPKTGKSHQIRVHLAHIGFPLAVDPIYHGKPGGLFLSSVKRGYRPKPGQSERPLIGRLSLHHHRMTLNAPNGSSLTIESPAPKDFRAVCAQLSKFR